MFNGYQKQPTKNTVQDEIELAIYKATKSKCIIHSSGRTDSGVHAYNQVFHFDIDSKIPDDKFKDVLNSFLPDGIYIKDSIQVHETFHSRYDIEYKEYVYKINKKEYDVIMRNYEWYPGIVDYTVFKNELKSIIGTHDFTSLTKTNEKSNVRTIFDISFVENDHYIYTYIRGNGFLRYMVRNIIASAIIVAQNKTSLDLLGIINKKDNNILKDIAPSGGLYMNKVKHYD
jgi:tRNA pseudouridine38-40 synthase